MDYRIIPDSCCELPDELKNLPYLERVPLTITVEDRDFVDDESLDVDALLHAMKQSKHAPKSACPSPHQYLAAMRDAAAVFAVTISSKLSGSYNSAVNACQLLRAEKPDVQAHVFDSLSASAGEAAICMQIEEFIKQGLPFEKVIEKVNAFIRSMQTLFILDNLDTLIKAGRMSRITGYVASVMSLRPIMTAEQGTIRLQEKARGSVQAFSRLVEMIGEHCSDFSERNLVITHCRNERMAQFIRAEAAKRYAFRSIHVMPTKGLSTMYANEGGVIIAF